MPRLFVGVPPKVTLCLVLRASHTADERLLGSRCFRCLRQTVVACHLVAGAVYLDDSLVSPFRCGQYHFVAEELPPDGKMPALGPS